MDKQFELKVDASGYTIGAVLMQRQEDGKHHPVGFYSVTLNDAERNYDIYCNVPTGRLSDLDARGCLNGSTTTKCVTLR
jgi:hypothetical protein